MDTDNFIGRVVRERYEIVDFLGTGGMAEVFKAKDLRLNRFVAFKLMHSFLAKDAQFRTRFEREAQAVARLNHPHIVQVYDFDYAPKERIYYMVMEFIDGGSLEEHLEALSARGERMALDRAVKIISDLSKALFFAHSNDMIHRDIKPANVMMDHKGRVVLTDFGIAKIIGGGSTLTASGAMMGTPAYMAPEQGLGQPGDHRADIYSLGVMFFQLVTGKRPYEADTPLAVVLKHVSDPLPSPRDLVPDLPRGIEYMIFRMMAKKPEDRYQSFSEVIADLQKPNYAAEAAAAPRPGALPVDTLPASGPVADAITEAGIPSPPTPVAVSRAKKRPAFVYGALTLAVLIGIVGALVLLKGKPTSDDADATQTTLAHAALDTRAPDETSTITTDDTTPRDTTPPVVVPTTSPATPTVTDTPPPTNTPTPATPIAQVRREVASRRLR